MRFTTHWDGEERWRVNEGQWRRGIGEMERNKEEA